MTTPNLEFVEPTLPFIQWEPDGRGAEFGVTTPTTPTPPVVPPPPPPEDTTPFSITISD